MIGSEFMDSEIDSNLKETLTDLPDATGVYLFKDREGKALYIGKAKSIKNRVKSHFSSSEEDITGSLISKNTVKIEFILTDSEIEALLLESELIKKFKPKYNINLKDDKSFPYIVITEEEFPRIFVRRHRRKADLENYRRNFGPFTNRGAVNRTLNFLYKVFPVCSCYPKRKKRIRPCLKYYIKRCSSPCVGKITQKDYLKNIANIELFLDGKKKDLIEQLKKKMEEASINLDFESAAILRDQIWVLEKTIINQRVIASETDMALGIVELREMLDLPKDPVVIEAFDISNLSGTDSTGSLVYFVNGKPEKGEYRRFKIKTVTGPDDVAMMAEIIERRYQRLVKAQKNLPDLIIVDGGKPQLNAAIEVLLKLKLEIPVIGLAKKFEHVFKPGYSNAIIISPDSPALFLLQRVRDEAHRFALKYHQLLRKKRIKSGK